MDNAPYIAHQFVLRYIVEELLQVYIHYPFVSFIEVFHEFQYYLLTTSARAEAVAVFLELYLKYRRQDLDY